MIGEGDIRVGADDAAARWDLLASVRDDAVRCLRKRAIAAGDAEDHVHEAMVRLCARPLRDLGLERLRALLVRAALNIAIDGHRRSGRYRRLLPRLFDPSTAASPEEIVAVRSEAQWLAADLSELGTLERGALAYAVTGRGIAEIADALGVEYKVAENALGRARRKLRLRATGAAVALGGLLRRLRWDDHGAAVTASTLAAAAALLLLSPGSNHRQVVAVPAPVPTPRVLSAAPLHVQLVGRPAAIPVTPAFVSVRVVPAPQPARPAPAQSATPPAANTPALPSIPPTYQNCSRPALRGSKYPTIPSPVDQIVGCVMSPGASPL